jgi:hypothetical protein
MECRFDDNAKNLMMLWMTNVSSSPAIRVNKTNSAQARRTLFTRIKDIMAFLDVDQQGHKLRMEK